MSHVVGVLAGSAVGADPVHAAAAAHLADAVARRGATVVFGGSTLGLMGVVGNAVLAAGGTLVGVMPEPLASVQPVLPGVQRLVSVPTATARDEAFQELCDTVVVLPGGAGILGEVSSMLLGALSGGYGGRLVLLNTAGYYDHLVAFLRDAVAGGFLAAEALARCEVADDPAAAVGRVFG